MKRRCLSLALALLVLLLAGCGGVYPNYVEIEELMLIQTLGLDGGEDGICASLAAATEARGQTPKQLYGQGPTIASAIEDAKARSLEDQIYLAHVGQLLFGQEAALAGLESYLSYLYHQGDIRLDIPIFIIKDGRALDAVMGCGQGDKGVSALVTGVENSYSSSDDAWVPSLMDLCLDLERYGSALVCALELGPATETESPAPTDQEEEEPTQAQDVAGQESKSEVGDQALTLIPAGFAVIRQSSLCAFIDMDYLPAVGLLTGAMPQSLVALEDDSGKRASLELLEGGCQVLPVWAGEGELKGLEVRARVRAALLESSPQGQQQLDHITALLESRISELLAGLIARSMALKADFLGLAGWLERSDPAAFQAMEGDFLELLPGLELRVSVQGEIVHSNDVRDDLLGN